MDLLALITFQLFITMALTGFVCTHKIQAEEECLASNVLCYECDSRLDPNCADPFDFSYPTMSLAGPAEPANETVQPTAKRLPQAAVCHGCCVKITSRSAEGGAYVKRTCTTNLQINFFMVGLVCMKESGDRGKMCFCEQDYCNGAPAHRRPHLLPALLLLLAAAAAAALHLLPIN